FLLRLNGEQGTDYRFLDARETAPQAAHRNLYLDDDNQLQRVINGPLAAGIPGLPAALVHLAQHYGQLPLQQSLAPAVAAAEEGFAVGESTAPWSVSACRPCSRMRKRRVSFSGTIRLLRPGS